MKFGITLHTTDSAMSPVALACEVEARGFDSFYVPEHTHIPVSRRTPPPSGEAELPEMYLRTYDPYIALSAAAAVTTTLRLGTGVALPAQHDAIVLAKEIATLDLVSQGRFVWGIGFGWNREEMESHGVDPRERRDVVRETVQAMRALWGNDVAEFHGRHIDFEPCWQWPKPVQRPGPPVLIGAAAGPKAFAAIAAYGDGWIPIGGGGIRAALPELHRAVEAAGRDPATLSIVPLGVTLDSGKVDYYESLGCTEVVFRVPTAPRDQVMPVLDEA
ncbi:MAG TPA: TIGR03619 family F420-dependent LLM class oxidoreductase, partial [Acidimicrobiales bacterium]|nr:TIGR03619 family F420-dependent LLM class oxidoreductase [Acidimicrobiales bacterium]